MCLATRLKKRFELDTCDLVVVDCRLSEGVMTIYHTHVPPALRGRGVGSALVRGALEDVRRRGFKVAPPLLVADYVAQLSSRILGLSHTHDLIADENWKGARLDDLAARQLAPFLDADRSHILYDGPLVVLSPAAAQNIGLALHELGTNALKYGALSKPQGKIHLTWRLTENALVILWREEGGSPAPSNRKGFGYTVLAKLTPDALEGQSTLTFCPDGFSWQLSVPLARIVSPTSLSGSST
jgi:two-component sensor histidine kinase